MAEIQQNVKKSKSKKGHNAEKNVYRVISLDNGRGMTECQFLIYMELLFLFADLFFCYYVIIIL